MSPRSPDYRQGQHIPGTVYRVHHVLGAGGMGTVYDVEDTTVGRRYVLKTLHSDLADRTDLAQRLSREARALAKLQHPNIVEVYTSGTTADALRLPYYVMERLNGQSLRAVLERKGRLALTHAIDIEIDLMDALDHAHASGIVHRDVKPDNIFICKMRDRTSLAKLLDFGIIKLTTSNSLTGARFIGTFRYAPPEQILGREVTPQSDLYAAALVLYEMIAGRGPFDDFTGEMEIGKAQVQFPPPLLSRYATVPPELDRLVSSALAKELKDRPLNAVTFGQELRAIKKQLQGDIRDAHSAATVDVLLPSADVSVVAPLSSSDLAPPEPSAQQSTRIQKHADMVAPTQQGGSGPTLAMPTVRRDTQRMDGTLASPGAPLAESMGPAPVPYAPAGVDRNAETRAAAPLAEGRAPMTDTQPIPLVPKAPPVDLVEPYVPKNETLGAHTSDPARPKGSLLAIAAAVAVVLVALGVGARVLFHHPAPVAPATTATVVATPAPTPTPTPTTTPTPTPTPTLAPTPAATPSATAAVKPRPKPSATATETATPHRPGSGL